MRISSVLNALALGLSEDNYEQLLSEYRLWMKIGAAHGWINDDQLRSDIRAIMKPNLVYPSSNQFIHPTSHLLFRFITDIGLDPVLSTYASNVHDPLCSESLERFFDRNLVLISDTRWDSSYFSEFYTSVNFLAHWVNLGYLCVEDVQDHILQSLTFQPTVCPHQLISLAIFLKISGATFAAYVDPSVMDHCCDLLESSNLTIITGLAEVRVPILTIKINHEYRALGDFATSRKRLGRSSSPSGSP